MKRLTCIFAMALAVVARADQSDIVIADFEGTSYGEWKSTGESFGLGPAQGTLPHQMAVSGFAGHGLVNSFFKGDGTTGTLTSPEFKIERPFISFLIGGGGWVNRTCMNLIIGTGVVRRAVGPNTEEGGSEALEPAQWDVSEFAGKTAHLEIIDSEKGGWGHINVDQIVQSDRKLPPVAKPMTRGREIVIDKKYLLFPVANGSKKEKKQLVSVIMDGETVRKFDIEMSDTPDWFAHLDVAAWRGKKVVIRVQKISDDSKAMALIQTSDSIWHESEIYHEPLRAQFHFSPRRGWNNDPNGMVFADGEYHLYFQHNPYGWPWGNMHWGHATSPEMVHWREQPEAIYPRQHGDWVFSGSAVVDRSNTSGWKKGTNDLIVAAFTSTARGECIVYSNDGGLTFTEYEGNPIVKHSGRDPRLLWHEASKQWVMAVYDELEGKRWIAFHTSPDLKKWTFQSRIADFYECPDIFELPVQGAATFLSPKEGDKSVALTKKKWVLTAASSDYMVGEFDGHEFKPETPKLKGHQGRGFYAAQTFSHDPQGRVIRIGWMQTETRGMPFNQSMSLPIELGLVATAEGPRMTWTPAKELESLRARPLRSGPIAIKDGDANPLANLAAELVEVRAEIDPGDAAEIAFTLRGLPVVYDVKKQELAVNGHRAPAPLRDGKLTFIAYVDRIVTEVFASDGLTYVPMPFIAKPEDRSLGLAVKGGTAKFSKLDVFALKSAW